MDILRLYSVIPTPPDLIGKALVISDFEPWFSRIGCACLKKKMKMLYEGFRKFAVGVVNDIVDGVEVVYSSYRQNIG